jgi:hypothetical protein
LIPINKDARIRLRCSYKSRRAPSMMLGITPRLEDFACVFREEFVRVLIAHPLDGERTHTGAMIHVTTLDHAVREEAVMPFRAVLLVLAPMRVIRPFEHRFVSFFLGTEGPTLVPFCKRGPALAFTPWFGLRFCLAVDAIWFSWALASSSMRHDQKQWPPASYPPRQ